MKDWLYTHVITSGAYLVAAPLIILGFIILTCYKIVSMLNKR
ncbi:hypothetical protein [Aneurinibacillus tyrosinisolvens]|nr:hypothetical protein [Aneurinibacillus tyrosinisolvens]